MCDDQPGDNKNRPALCSCWNLTMVGFKTNQYWPRDENGWPTGHHPQCQYYTMPLRFENTKAEVKEMLKKLSPMSTDRAIAFALYDIISFLEAKFPDEYADGST